MDNLAAISRRLRYQLAAAFDTAGTEECCLVSYVTWGILRGLGSRQEAVSLYYSRDKTRIAIDMDFSAVVSPSSPCPRPAPLPLPFPVEKSTVGSLPLTHRRIVFPTRPSLSPSSAPLLLRSLPSSWLRNARSRCSSGAEARCAPSHDATKVAEVRQRWLPGSGTPLYVSTPDTGLGEDVVGCRGVRVGSPAEANHCP